MRRRFVYVHSEHLLAIALLAACSEKPASEAEGSARHAARRATSELVPDRVVDASLGSAVAPVDSAVAQAAASDPAHGNGATKPSTTLSPEEVLASLLNREIDRWTPEQAALRLARLGLERVNPLPGSMQLATATPTSRLHLNYLPGNGGTWRFADAMFELPRATVQEAESLYKELSALLRKKLGKPTSVKDDSRYPTSGYKLGGRVDVTLGAVLHADEGKPYVALSLAAPQS
jgi:hypothetical protein